MTRKVLIAAPVDPVLTDGLKAAGYSLVEAMDINQGAAPALIADCVGVITSTRLQLDKELLDAAPKLEWIGRMGSGMEVIDVPYAQSKGIACYGSPEGNRNAVAEHALGLLLSLTKKITSSHIEVGHGQWIRDANRGIELEGKTIGIIGFGHTGKAFAKKLSGFDMRVLAYDKYHPIEGVEGVISCRELEPIYEAADIISFHVPLQEDTIHYFNDSFLERMKKPFILINTSRGSVADTEAIYQGLLSHKITGVGLDVVEEEPLAKMSPRVRQIIDNLSRLPHVVITPHIAGYSYEALYKMSKVLLMRIVTSS